MSIRDISRHAGEAREKRWEFWADLIDRVFWTLIGVLVGFVIGILILTCAHKMKARQSPPAAVPFPPGRDEGGRVAPPATARPAAPFLSGPPADLPRLLRAIRQVESGGRATPPDGDGGEAIGQYQIHFAYWQDARVPGRYQHCRQEPYARRVVLAYWRRYAPAVAARAAMAGKPEALASGDLEVLARTHNGGPRGAASPATVGYWHRIRADLGT